MPDNLTRQILREHLVDGDIVPGRPISIRMDQALLQDATGTMALMQFEELGEPRVKVERAVQSVDHNVVQLDYKNPDDHRMLQALARKYGLHFSRPATGSATTSTWSGSASRGRRCSGPTPTRLRRDASG
jgi:homoaconitase/3-isopropylmalate dehydratase large subunit